MVTVILNDEAGADERLALLLPMVYEQLRAAAQRHMAAERPGHTLAATALVHEAYLKLVGPRQIPWQNRAHFYAAAAEAMRQILLDHARARGSRKRGGAKANVPLNEVAAVVAGSEHAPNGDQTENQPDFVALDAAIGRLEARDPRAGQVVRLKYYAGLEIAQVALALGVSERTVKNDWAFAKAWLERALMQGEDSGDAGAARAKSGPSGQSGQAGQAGQDGVRGTQPPEAKNASDSRSDNDGTDGAKP